MFRQISIVLFLILPACSATTEKYFVGESIPPTLIEPPFAKDSLEWKSEIEHVIKVQRNFNLNELELASREKHLRPDIFVQFIGRDITRKTHPHLYHLMDRVFSTSRDVTKHAKQYWNVPRPYLVDKRINMFITPSQGQSYPSGHAVGSYVGVQILALLIPTKKDDLENLAKKILQRRVLIGMHYPHDLIAGEQMARLVLGGLMQNKEFQDDFAVAAKELKKKSPALVATNNDALPAQ
ncbi:MAG: phosphatase PAP2 family protein [Alphaproteobacteria bacterium]|nr:phosphatase PAP2 family protein [Alphaproteobacteria bacterium]